MAHRTLGRRGGWSGARASGAAGAVAGFVATGLMTLAMERLHQRLPEQERHSLPPRLLTEQVLGPTGASGAATLVGHFAYGAATGALFPAVAPLLRPFLRSSPAVDGAVFGVLVWAGSYLGWIPATGLLTPATRHPARRNGLMIVAHAVWGTATAVLFHSLRHPAPAFAEPAPPEAPEIPAFGAGGAEGRLRR